MCSGIFPALYDEDHEHFRASTYDLRTEWLQVW